MELFSRKILQIKKCKAGSLLNLSCIFLFVFTFLPSVSTCQTWENRAKLFVDFAIENHFSPPVINDSFSSALFFSFLEKIDPRKTLLTHKDIYILEKYKHSLDELCLTGQGEFLEVFHKLFHHKLLLADSLVKSEILSPIDFATNEKIQIRPKEKRTWPQGDEAWVANWRKLLKEAVLISLYHQSRDSTGYDEIKLAEALKGEPEARKKVMQIFIRRIQSKLKNENLAGETFMEALAESFDPHSAYFSPEEKGEYASHLSAENFSLGIIVEETENGEIAIAKLVPGGPAWKCGMLHKEDILLKIVSPEGIETDIGQEGPEETRKIIAEMGRGKIELTVRKADGKVITVVLAKEIQREEENTVKSLVLDGHIKVGYISLPGFYTDWEDPSGHGCANDVAKELIKLKKENVNGIILDLRYNGGGSMKEAIELAGIFIDAGPILIFRDKSNTRTTLKDARQGAIFTGPLLVLINGASASASEFLAIALQEHGRAILAGSLTYGKGTGQVIDPLDQNHSNPDEGYVKITSSKFYRLDGTSHQLEGVHPDVEIEDPFANWFDREERNKNSLKGDTIIKKVYFTKPPIPDYSPFQLKSRARLAQNEKHKGLMIAASEVYSIYKKDTSVSLLPGEYFSWLEKKEKALKKLEEADELPIKDDFSVKNTSFDENLFTVDEYAREFQEALRENIRKDLYLREAVNILEDYISP